MQSPTTRKDQPFSQDSLESRSLGNLNERNKEQTTRRTILATSRLVLGLLVGVTTALFFFRAPIISRMTTISPQSPRAASSLAGWHSRLLPYTGPIFAPTYDSLAFVQLRNAQTDPEGFTVALFTPNIVVDARGVISTLSAADWESLKQLALGAVSDDLPVTGNFRNQWRIQQARTGSPIEWLRVIGANGSLKEVAVYGYDGAHWNLDPPVGAYTALPEALKDAFGATKEARDGYERGSEDAELIARIKAILPEE